MYYQLIKPLLFRMDPEKAHHFVLQSLQRLHALQISRLYPHIQDHPKTVMGLQFKNPIGLAAGLDKNGDYIEALSALGFGFIEVGTVTPLAQIGNPLPRLFRLTEHEALINRMGFNNKGVDYLADRLRTSNYQGVLGVNIGKNRWTPNESAVDDYLYGFRRLAPYADYITINISSPNTLGLRALQQDDMLRDLLGALKEEQALYQHFHHDYVPLAVKIAPDLSVDEVRGIAKILLAAKIDGVIATNTTVDRSAIDGLYSEEQGGLSGKPLRARATEVLRVLKTALQGQIPIIAVGGIHNAESATEKLQAGADLIQVYTGLIYQGPALLHDIAAGLAI